MALEQVVTDVSGFVNQVRNKLTGYFGVIEHVISEQIEQ